MGTVLSPPVGFPQYRGKHRAAPLFTATEFHRYASRRSGRPLPVPPRGVVLVFGERWRRYLSQRFRGVYDRGTGLYHVGPNVGIMLVPGPGAPFATIVVEELAALGVKRFLIVGMAGSLQPGVRVGSYVLCTKALRDEGTSHHYRGPGLYAHPSADLTKALRATLAREGVPFAEGPSWTTDAVYRETPPEIRRYRRAGILTVEMEASAVFAVSGHRGCRAAALFVISDHLDDAGWEPRFFDTRRPLRQGLTLAIRTLRAAPGRRRVGTGPSRARPRS